MNKLRAFLLMIAIAFLLNAVLSDRSMLVEAAEENQGDEKNLWNSMLHSFGPDGTANLTALISTLNDPNLNKLARSLGRANFTELEEVLSSKKVNIEDLMKALRKYELLEDTKHLLRADENHFMSTLERWANKLSTMRERIFGKNGLPATTMKTPAPTPPPPSNVEQSPMVKKSGMKSAEDDVKKPTATESAPSDEPIFVRTKKETPLDANVHIGGGGKGDDLYVEKDKQKDEFNMIAVWLISCAGLAVGILLLVGAFKLCSMAVEKYRGEEPVLNEPVDAYIVV